MNYPSPTALIKVRIDFASVFIITLGPKLPELRQKYPWECCGQKYGFHSPQFLQMPDTELPYTHRHSVSRANISNEFGTTTKLVLFIRMYVN
jgi:hypothetical protein